MNMTLPSRIGKLVLAASFFPWGTKRKSSKCEELSIHYKNKQEFDTKLEKVIEGGVKNLRCVADFDFTLTKFFLNGKRGCSCHKIIEDCGLLDKTYHQKAQELQGIYYPLEVLPGLLKSARVQHMIDWVKNAHSLLIQSCISRSNIKEAVETGVNEGRIRLREGVLETMQFFYDNNIPLVVFSAGIADVLEWVIHVESKKRSINAMQSNISVVSNRCIFDENDVLIDFEHPVFHVFNKSGSSILEKNKSFFEQWRYLERKNMILFGDSLGDLSMSNGLLTGQDDTIIAIGFLNDRTDRLEEYLKHYDVVIMGDPEFHKVFGLIFQSFVSSSGK